MAREDELIRKTAQGDREAMEELIALYYPALLRYCRWHTPDRETAQDAVQETFLKVIRYFGSYRHRGEFRAFLYRVAANTCIDMARRRWRTETALTEDGEEPAYVEPGFSLADGDLALAELVAGLKEEQREAVLLRYGQDMTLKEVAETLGLPVRTVQSRLRRALRAIREKLEREDA